MNMTKLAKALRDLADALEDELPPALFDPTPPEPDDSEPEPTITVPTSERLSITLSEAAKQHGRKVVMEIMAGRKVADLTEAERVDVYNKVTSL